MQNLLFSLQNTCKILLAQTAAYCRIKIKIHKLRVAEKLPLIKLPGNDLLSQDSTIQVSSALEVLTSVFEIR